MPDKVTCGMVRARLAEPDAGKGFILDGFPGPSRSPRRSTRCLPSSGLSLDAVVEFAVADDVVVERLLGRGRSDDTEEVIRNRQKVYRDETAPLLAHYHDKLVSVDAVGTVPEITARVRAPSAGGERPYAQASGPCSRGGADATSS